MDSREGGGGVQGGSAAGRSAVSFQQGRLTPEGSRHSTVSAKLSRAGAVECGRRAGIQSGR